MGQWETAPEVDPSSVSSISSPFQERKKKSRHADQEEPKKRIKTMKMRDLEPMMRSEEAIMSSILNPEEKGNREINTSNEDGISKIPKTTELQLLNHPLNTPMSNSSSFQTDAAALRLGDSMNFQHSMATTSEIKNDSQAALSLKLGVDLNNPFYPYKKLGQVSYTDASECGSTTGPVENSESMRRWNEMKQNGFISSPKAIAPIPKLKVRQPRRKKVENGQKKRESAKGELASKCPMVGSPSGLLSGLNPGIIKHVRNSKQVNSIIEAMLQSQKLEKQELRHKSFEQPLNRGATVADQLDLSLNKAFDATCFGSKFESSESEMLDDKLNNDGSNESPYNSEFDENALMLKLSSGVLSMEHTNSAAITDLSIDQENITSISFKAASVAYQWLGLIQQDVNDRLSALRRSKKRVRNMIQMELPLLLSGPRQNCEPIQSHSEECHMKETLEMHMARWKILFCQMEKTLLEEGKHLEKWLRQVEELHSQCEKGLKYSNGLSSLNSLEDASGEWWERECAVRAAAASIYSTSNFVMTAR